MIIATSPPGTDRFGWPSIAKTIAMNVLAWTVICAVGALGSYSDVLRDGSAGTYGSVLGHWLGSHLLMMVLSSGLSLALARWPALFESARRAAVVYGAVLVLFMPLQLYYVSLFLMHMRGVSITLADGWPAVMKMRKFGWFTEYAWTTGTVVAMAAIGSWRQARVREQAWQRAQTDNLNLRLALEEQRMMALRAQLEPHFIFNALNAISALVRTDDKAVALTGISRLSDLLRYALSATLRDTVSVAEEMQFVRDYLALQRLRYGDRLRVDIDGDEALLHQGDCPPLLLQPLIENALRHDLDCHGGPSDIRLSFRRLERDLLISVSNPVNAHAAPNPGTGLGLRNTRARLQLTHAAASLRTELVDDRFLAEIRMPLSQLA